MNSVRADGKGVDYLTGDYAERVYAGVLGKIIGVYAGRPFEGWDHERILGRLGEIDRYVAAELGVPLVVTDDDISGTFTFLRALADNGDDPNLTPEQIGGTWLNYIIEDKTILWWGGIGMSTEHTAYLRLKHGIPAPQSGSIKQNGTTVAEQIGAQIFIEGWGLIHPGQPERAADFARRAASVSHDGEAIYGAQVVAALVAQAFVESGIQKLLDVALAQIPNRSVISDVIKDLRKWHAAGLDWRQAFQELKTSNGYDKHPGNCHVVPNHGIVILALLYGEGDFSKSLMIANTCGWDTDCNSANVGCIVGVMNGLAGIDAGYDWRGPVKDRLYLPTADGGRCVSDAVMESNEIVRVAHAIRGLTYEPPKNGARFSFAYPGAIQGFEGQGLDVRHDDGSLLLTLSRSEGAALTSTFPGAEVRKMPGYSLVASPTLSPGQAVRAQLRACGNPVSVAVVVKSLAGNDEPILVISSWAELASDEEALLRYTVPDVSGYPITDIGIAVRGKAGDEVVLESLTWDGTPTLSLKRTEQGSAWQAAWVNGVDDFQTWSRPIGVSQNEGTGLLIYGCREWEDISLETNLTLNVAEDAGIAVRVQGLRRYYALRLTRHGTAQLIKCNGKPHVIAEAKFRWQFDDKVNLRLTVQGNLLTGIINGVTTIKAVDEGIPLRSGAVGIVVTEGRVAFDAINISPA
jgi:ADP-ribosylglycohydrolase